MADPLRVPVQVRLHDGIATTREAELEPPAPGRPASDWRVTITTRRHSPTWHVGDQAAVVLLADFDRPLPAEQIEALPANGFVVAGLRHGEPGRVVIEGTAGLHRVSTVNVGAIPVSVTAISTAADPDTSDGRARGVRTWALAAGTLLAALLAWQLVDDAPLLAQCAAAVIIGLAYVASDRYLDHRAEARRRRA
ncbi:MAG TPA: hypothetical protein VGD67_09880 [Pseudonocardiaceae bacterium]